MSGCSPDGLMFKLLQSVLLTPSSEDGKGHDVHIVLPGGMESSI